VSNLSAKQIVAILIVLLVAGNFVRGPKPEIVVPAEPLFSVAGFLVTNTFVATWVTIVVLLLLFRAATSNMQPVPRGVQNVFEMAVEALHSLVMGIAGERYGRYFFPLVATIFFFVITNSWLSLIPGFGTVGLVHEAEHEEGIPFQQAGPLALVMPGATVIEPGGHAPEGSTVGKLVPILRGANTDLNTTLGLALIAMVFVEFWGIRANGLVGYGSKFVNVGNLLRGQVAFGLIDVIVGFLEFISELARVVSFAFRLFGNMFAGEVLLLIIMFLVPWVFAILFYGFEVFVGFIQAVVFAGLTLVFTTMAVAGHGEGHERAEGHH